MDMIKLSFKDLLYLVNHGFVESFQNTFIKQLQCLEQTRRPIHCTDKKRKIMYVKDKDRWEKDDDHKKITNAIDNMNIKQLKTFSAHSKQRDEDFLDDEKNLDNNNKIIIEMCSYNKETQDSIKKKLLKHISDIVPIDK